MTTSQHESIGKGSPTKYAGFLRVIPNVFSFRPDSEHSYRVSMPTRRSFLQSVLLSAAAPLGLRGSEFSDLPVCVFNKPLQHLDYGKQAELVAEMGFVGIEGTVRKGGHVEPESVEKDLPRQVEALRANGVDMTLMTTDVNNVDEEIHRRVLTTAAEQGVRQFRMGSIKYDSDRPIPDQLKEIRGTFQEMVEFCRPLGIRPLYQNHAGAGRLGAGLWDLRWVLADIDPADAGVAFDIRHATVEGGQSWPTEFQLMRPWFGFVYCKDFIWKEGSARPQNVPLGSGRVDYSRFVSMLKKSEYDGPISLHMEYKDHRNPDLLPESIEAIRNDIGTLRELLSKA